MSNRKIYVVGSSLEYANWMQGKLTSSIEEADLVVFTGGEDVTPSLYGEPRHPSTYNSYQRDVAEMAVFKKAKALDKHMIGICRGSQFLCVMNGGKLVQNQQNLYSTHPIHLKDGSILEITSTHHQAMCPFNLEKDEYDIIAWGEGLSSYHKDGEDNELSEEIPDFKECEIVYFPKTKCLGIQGHPEYSYQDKKSLEYLRNLLDNFLKDELQCV